MTERKLHPDNKLIDAMSENPTPSQGSSSGGNIHRHVGTRSELERATDPDSHERAYGADNPAQDAKKGPKTRAAIQDSRDNS